MLAKFDPVGDRNYWLKYFLDYLRMSDPERVSPSVRPHYAQSQTSSMVEAYLLGLADEVRPMLERSGLHVTGLGAPLPAEGRVAFSFVSTG